VRDGQSTFAACFRWSSGYLGWAGIALPASLLEQVFALWKSMTLSYLPVSWVAIYFYRRVKVLHPMKV
jgi:hypothetical protein